MREMRIELLSLPDLVSAKKHSTTKTGRCCGGLWKRTSSRIATIRNRRRLHSGCGSRTPVSMLLDLARDNRSNVTALLEEHPLLLFALQGDDVGLATALMEEEKAIREVDRVYWLPLKAELERLRHSH